MGRLTREEIKKIAPNYKVAVETGLWKGEQLLVISETFEKTYGIELDPHYAKISQEKAPKSEVIQGDTRDKLPLVSEKIQEPCVFFLDAHYCKLEPPIAKSEFPLWDELKTINARNLSDIVIVDDVHTFGKKRDDLLFKEGDKEWEHVTPGNILEYFPQAKRSEIYKDSFIVWL
jgi:hypothetical protein